MGANSPRSLDAVSRLWHVFYAHRIAASASAALAGIALALAAFPEAAWANFITDAINDFLLGSAQGMFDGACNNLESISAGQMTNAFDELFVGSGAYDIISAAHATVVNSLAYGALAVGFLVQLVRIANRLDGNAAVPGVKEVAFLLIFFVIFKFVIDNSMQFCQAVYTGTVELIQTLPSTGGSVSIDLDLGESDDPMGMFLGGVVFLLGSFLAQAVAYFVVFARSLQIYVFTVFAPISLGLLVCDETRSFGMGFVKNYFAVCFAGVIIMLVLLLYPSMVQSIGNTSGAAALPLALALTLLVIFALTKAGAWARDVFGG